MPTPEQEDLREEGRLREQLKKSRQQWEARGRSLSRDGSPSRPRCVINNGQTPLSGVTLA